MLFLNFQMFTLEHFITLAVIFSIILILFFTRKFFIKYKYLDYAIRFLLAFLIIGSEIKLRMMNPPESFIRNFPIPLCGHLLWIAGIALISNSTRIYKRIYPLCLLGATLSLIVVEGIPNFPEFRAWQYFFVHGGFLIGACYLVFTRKINKFTLKDYGWSCLLALVMGGIMNIFVMLGIRDDYMIIHPAGQLKPLFDKIGQLGYTLLYCLFSAAVMGFYAFLTWLLTKHRRDEDENLPKYKDNLILDKISNKYTKTMRWVSVVSSIAGFVYLAVVQDQTKSKAMVYVLLVLLILIFALIIFNEVLHNYEIRERVDKQEIELEKSSE